MKAHVYAGSGLPVELQPFEAQPYTAFRLLQEQLNSSRGGTPMVAPKLTPRPMQVEAARFVAKASTRWRGCLLADEPGTGKTGAAIIGARAVAKLRGGSRILVIADRPAKITVGHWQRSIAGFGDGSLTWCIVTWDQLHRVLNEDWDVVIADEAHALRHTTTLRWRRWSRLSGHRRTHKTAPFVIAVTATPAHSPLELSYLAPLFAQIFDEPVSAWTDLPTVLGLHGIHLADGAWTENPISQATDLDMVRGWMETASPPAMLHRPSPWGEVPVGVLPVTLSWQEQVTYAKEWGEFCTEMKLARRGRNIARGRAALIRFRQKAGLLRVPATVEWAIAQVEAGRQVAISCEFVTTAADPIRDGLLSAGVNVSAIYGRDRFDTEKERLRFQQGINPVIVFTPVASLSLHANEILPNRRQATNTPRVGLFHSARYSGIQAKQVTGRTHRDGMVSPWYIGVAANTVEEQVAQTMVRRIHAAKALVGGQEDLGLREVGRILGCDWLPLEDLHATEASA